MRPARPGTRDMGSSRMAINNLLQDAPASPRQPPVPPPAAQFHEAHTASAVSRNNFPVVPLSGPASPALTPGKKPVRSRRKDAPLLVQRAATSPAQPLTYNRTSTPTLPHNAVAQAQRTQPSPPLSSASTLGSTRTISSTLSTPSGDHRPALGARIMTTPPIVQQHRTPTEKMDFLAGTSSLDNVTL